MSKALLGTRFFEKYSSRQVKSIARYHLGISKHHFIHIPKNGGLTIRNSRAMRQRLVFSDPYFHKSKEYTHDLAKEMNKHGMHHGNQHARLIDIHPEVRRRLQAVAVIRNPWARTFSRFTFRLHALKAAGKTADFSQEAFREFLEQRHEYGGREFFWHRAIKGWFPQLDYVRDENGKLDCDIIRLEHLDDEMMAYFGVNEMQKRNVSGAKVPKYTEIYTDQTIQIVADWYKSDVDFFGFDFVGAASKNTHFKD